jgi:hypothetical protein
MRILEAKIINRYADKVLQRNTTKLNKNDWNEIGKDLIPNDKTRSFYSKKIVMSNIEVANSRILAILSNNGIDENKPFQLLKKAEEIAISKDNSGDLIKIAKELIEIQDLKPQKIQYSETRKDIDYNNMLPQQVSKTISTTKSLDNSIKDKQTSSGNDETTQANE